MSETRILNVTKDIFAAGVARETKAAYAPGDMVQVAGAGQWLVVAGPSRHGCYCVRKIYSYRPAAGELGLSCVASIGAAEVYDYFGTAEVPAEDRATWSPSFEGGQAAS